MGEWCVVFCAIPEFLEAEEPGRFIGDRRRPEAQGLDDGFPASLTGQRLGGGLEIFLVVSFREGRHQLGELIRSVVLPVQFTP